MDHINVCAALFLIAVLSLTLTPVLSPYRIAAGSQFELAEQAWSANGRQQPGAYAGGLEALDYLRFDAGRYGRQRLAELAELPAPAGGAELRKAARDKLAQADRSDGVRVSVQARLQDMVVYPRDSQLDEQLLRQIQSDLMTSADAWQFTRPEVSVNGVFADLDADQTSELIVIAGSYALVYARDAQRWHQVGTMRTLTTRRSTDLSAAIEAGDIEVQEPRWRDLPVGGHVFRDSSRRP